MNKVKIPGIVIQNGMVCQVAIIPIKPRAGTDDPFIPEVE